MNPAANKGRFIVLEGVDGCGSTTQTRRLVERLRAAGHDARSTCEPSDGPIGAMIRAALERRLTTGAGAPHKFDWATLALLFAADRVDHVNSFIVPALAAGAIVVSDRYTLSSVAYQGARGLDWRRILAEGEAEFPRPDAVFLLEIDPAAGLARARARGRVMDAAFETAEFLARVAAIYRAIERDYVERIDAGQTADAVAAAVWRSVALRLGLPA